MEIRQKALFEGPKPDQNMSRNLIKYHLYIWLLSYSTFFRTSIILVMYCRVRELLECIENAHHEVHTIVLNGDILEMWYFDLNKPPPTNEELLKLWLSDTEFPALVKLRKSIKNLTENLDVKVRK